MSVKNVSKTKRMMAVVSLKEPRVKDSVYNGNYVTS